MSVMLWWSDGASKGIAVHAHSHRDTCLDLEPLLTIQLLSDVVQWTDSIWVEATQERRDRMNLVGNPVAVIEDEVDVEMGFERVPDPPECEQSDGYHKFQDVEQRSRSHLDARVRVGGCGSS